MVSLPARSPDVDNNLQPLHTIYAQLGPLQARIGLHADTVCLPSFGTHGQVLGANLGWS
jgi:hypothetical protein